MFNTKYYVQVIKQFELHSYNTELKKCTYGKLYYILRKRNLFKKDEMIKAFENADEALEACAKLNNK